jgi:thermitase
MVASMIHLVAPDAKIMPLRAFGANGAATISQIVAALHFAVDRNVNVVNMSFSVTEDSPALKAAIDFAASRGLILVAAAGNSGQATMVWPAAYANVIGVGSTDDFYVRAPWSNFGDALVSLAAPGADVITMYPQNHYAKVSGTSFSTPLVAGGAALLVDLNKKTDGAAAADALSHARALGHQELGAGELDLYDALTNLSKKTDGVRNQ